MSVFSSSPQQRTRRTHGSRNRQRSSVTYSVVGNGANRKIMGYDASNASSMIMSIAALNASRWEIGTNYVDDDGGTTDECQEQPRQQQQQRLRRRPQQQQQQQQQRREKQRRPRNKNGVGIGIGIDGSVDDGGVAELKKPPKLTDENRAPTDATAGTWWSCSICTYNNEGCGTNNCVMCDAPREDSANGDPNAHAHPADAHGDSGNPAAANTTTGGPSTRSSPRLMSREDGQDFGGGNGHAKKMMSRPAKRASLTRESSVSLASLMEDQVETFSKEGVPEMGATPNHGNNNNNNGKRLPWACQVCTYLNPDPMHLTCAVCGEERPKGIMMDASSPGGMGSSVQDIISRSCDPAFMDEQIRRMAEIEAKAAETERMHNILNRQASILSQFSSSRRMSVMSDITFDMAGPESNGGGGREDDFGELDGDLGDDDDENVVVDGGWRAELQNFTADTLEDEFSSEALARTRNELAVSQAEYEEMERLHDQEKVEQDAMEAVLMERRAEIESEEGSDVYTGARAMRPGVQNVSPQSLEWLAQKRMLDAWRVQWSERDAELNAIRRMHKILVEM